MDIHNKLGLMLSNENNLFCVCISCLQVDLWQIDIPEDGYEIAVKGACAIPFICNNCEETSTNEATIKVYISIELLTNSITHKAIRNMCYGRIKYKVDKVNNGKSVCVVYTSKQIKNSIHGRGIISSIITKLSPNDIKSRANGEHLAKLQNIPQEIIDREIEKRA